MTDLEFTTKADQIKKTMETHGTKYTDVKCSLCRRVITNNQLAYSMRVFKEPLCMGCQDLQKHYGKGSHENKKPNLD